MNQTIYFILTFFTLFTFSLGAQNISVTNFYLDEMDNDANLQGTMVLDQNGEKCALIKVSTTLTDFSFDTGALGVTKTLQKTAQIWVYVPHGVRKLSISHQKFGILNYQLPISIQKARTYVMELLAEKPLPIDHQRLTIKCQPENAVVSIDGEMVEIDKGKGELILKLGQHKYIVMANGYYQTDGTINIVADRPGKLTIELEPKEGTLIQTNNNVSKNTSISNISGETQVNGQKTNIANTIMETPNGLSCMVNGVTFEMIKVEGGTFNMGATPEQNMDASANEKPVHTVTLSTYYISKLEVTQELWEAVTGSNPSHFKGNNLPVENVNWIECLSFISSLNNKTGKKFRLPSEAEWEYACRGGNKSKGYIYSGGNDINEVAWISKGRSHFLIDLVAGTMGSISSVNGCITHEVGKKSPNELGIYDMSGNVWEWCQDVYDSKYYKKSSSVNPMGPENGSYHVIRGGGVDVGAKYSRSSARDKRLPDGHFNDLGLRIVLSE